MSGTIVIGRPGGVRASLAAVQRRRRKRIAGAAIAMRAAGWPDHAIAGALRISRRRLAALLAYGAARFADLARLVAADAARSAAA